MATERLTNDPRAVYQEAEKEVLDFQFDQDEQVLFQLSEFPSIAPRHFGLALTQKANQQAWIRFRQWDGEWNFANWPQGVFNLDRLRIVSEDSLVPADTFAAVLTEFEKLKTVHLPYDLNNPDALVLDGSEYQLLLNCGGIQQHYTWRAALPDMALFDPLMKAIVSLHPATEKRLFP